MRWLLLLVGVVHLSSEGLFRGQSAICPDEGHLSHNFAVHFFGNQSCAPCGIVAPLWRCSIRRSYGRRAHESMRPVLLVLVIRGGHGLSQVHGAPELEDVGIVAAESRVRIHLNGPRWQERRLELLGEAVGRRKLERRCLFFRLLLRFGIQRWRRHHFHVWLAGCGQFGRRVGIQAPRHQWWQGRQPPQKAGRRR